VERNICSALLPSYITPHLTFNTQHSTLNIQHSTQNQLIPVKQSPSPWFFLGNNTYWNITFCLIFLRVI